MNSYNKKIKALISLSVTRKMAQPAQKKPRLIFLMRKESTIHKRTQTNNTAKF